MDRYTVQKGKHAFRLWGAIIPLPSLCHDVRQMSWTVRFDKTCAYTLPGVDQQDWNKGGGVSFDLLTNHTDSAMWAWRYNEKKAVMELSAYCHIDGKRPRLLGTMYSAAHPGVGKEVCLELEIGQTARVSFQVDREARRYDFNFMVEGSGKSWPVGVGFTHEKKWGRVINPWFGGNNAAPQKMHLYMKRSS